MGYENIKVDPRTLTKYGIRPPQQPKNYPAPMVEGRGLCPSCGEPIVIVAAITGLNIQIGVKKDMLAALRNKKAS